MNTNEAIQVLVVGASGATGRLLVGKLLVRGCRVKAIVRSPGSFSESMAGNENLSLIHASVLDLSDTDMAEHASDCVAVVSCLGHTLSFRGIYGQPRRLVTEATRRLCNAITSNRSKAPTKFVLMNTTGNRNRDLDEPISFAQRCVIGLLRLLVPPHVDNENAADYLRTKIGQKDNAVEWVAVRPDGLIDEDAVSEYELHCSPIRSAIFDAGKTSRINVAHFMADLVTEEAVWDKWSGQMPVIYNNDSA
ncbi:MAG: hypothetical protein ACI92G_002398 [Candidatus Pelagisphaera sp.]|jgi:hypothetical protein